MQALSQHHLHYRKAILLNNTAVVHIENGNYDKARLLFRDALRELRNSTIDEDNCFSGNEGSCDACKKKNLDLEWSRNAPLHADLNLPLPEPDTSYIFRRAIILANRNDGDPSSLNSKSSSHHNNTVEESKAIIYNLALSYLLSGFINNSSSLLETAQQLFEKIIQFILCSNTNFDNEYKGKRCPCPKNNSATKKRSSLYLLEAAACNNLGWLNEEFCNFQMAQACYNEVFHRIDQLVRTGSLERREWEGFIQNLWRGDSESHQIAAAA